MWYYSFSFNPGWHTGGDGYRRYFNNDGTYKTGYQMVGGVGYFFDDRGRLQTTSPPVVNDKGFSNKVISLQGTGSGKVIDVPGASAANGIKPRYTIISKLHPNMCFDVANNGTANGAKIQLYHKNSSSAQKFKVVTYAQAVPNGTYAIQSSINTARVLNVPGASTANGANIQLYQANGTNAQKFKLTYYADTGYYEVVNAGSAKAVDIANGGAASGTNVQQYARNNTWAQRWDIVKSGSYYILYAANSGCVLDVSGGVANSGTNVQIYAYNGTAAQKWVLKTS
jgi:hypothetical protein